MRAWWLVGALGAGAVAIAATQDGPRPVAVSHERAPTVRAALVQTAPPVREVVLHGVTRATDRASVAFMVGGRVRSRRVRIGDRVAKGDVLATMDSTPFDHGRRVADASVADLQARTDQLARDRKRLEALDAGGSVTEAELDRVRTQEASVLAALAGAEARADEAARQRRESVLRAPFDGVVAAVQVEPGESLAAGQTVFQLSGGAGVEVAVQAPERVWARLTVGDAARIDLVGMGRTVEGSIRSVAGAGGPSGLLPIVVTVDDARAVAGLTAEVALAVPLPDGLTVPVAAVVDPVGAGPVVYAVREGAVARVPVEVGVLLGDRLLVEGGLEAGESVVVAGQTRLLPGDVVEVLP